MLKIRVFKIETQKKKISSKETIEIDFKHLIWKNHYQFNLNNEFFLSRFEYILELESFFVDEVDVFFCITTFMKEFDIDVEKRHASLNFARNIKNLFIQLYFITINVSINEVSIQMHFLHFVQLNMNICFARKLHYKFQWIKYARSWNFRVIHNWYISNVFKSSRSTNVTMLISSSISTRVKKWILMNALKKNFTNEIFLKMKFIDESAIVKFMKNVFDRFFHVARVIDNAQRITIYANYNDFHDRFLRTLKVIFFNSNLEKIASQMTELFIFVYVVIAFVIRETITIWYENWNRE